MSDRIRDFMLEKMKLAEIPVKKSTVLFVKQQQLVSPKLVMSDGTILSHFIITLF